MVRSADTALPDLGVGLIYSAEIEPLVLESDSPIQVLEVEPQTMWLHLPGASAGFKEPAGLLDHLAALPGKKLVHSVGAPVGGTRLPPPVQLGGVRRWAERLGAPWVSEHLSFNETREHHAGFFLAPRQTEAGLEAVVASVRALQAAMPVPVAVETGVNYLRRRPEEIPDGEFIAEVVRRTGCGILLDLHNVYTNALNGRQPMEQFLAALPLDRVWEIHLAGGMNMDGFWLDAHCDAIPERLADFAREVLPALPQVHALMFEAFPSFVPMIGLPKIRAQIERMRTLWDDRKRTVGTWAFAATPAKKAAPAERDAPDEWERQLAALVVGRTPNEAPLSRELADDPGVALMRKLVRDFRASMLVNVSRFTVRLLMLTLGEEGLMTVLTAFWDKVPPQFYATTEAGRFLDFLEQTELAVPRLRDVVAFERALMATAMDDQPRVVRFNADLLPLLRALAEGKLPEVAGREGDFEIEVTPDDLAGESGNAMLRWGQSAPSH